MNVGDKVFVVRYGSWGARDRYRAGEITNITTTGLIDVTFPQFAKPQRFSKDLREYGQRNGGERIDSSLEFTQRKRVLEEEARIDKAHLALLTVIEPRRETRQRYNNKAELVAELERLQALLNVAEQLISNCLGGEFGA